MKFRASFIAAVACSSLAVGPATASSLASQGTTPFNWALNYSYNPNASGIGGQNPCCDYVNQLVTQPLASATSSYSQNGPWGSVAGFSEADLSTGTLRSSARAWSSGIGGAHPYMQSNAIFGDGFTTTTPLGTPFNWGNADATFHMKLTGTANSTDAFTDSAGFAMMFLMQKGTLDPSVSFLDPATSLGYFVWEFGGTGPLYYTDTNGLSHQLTITQNYASIPSSIDATFAPGGDFDWVLLLGESGQEAPGNAFNIDLSHTLELSYTGPAGSVTTSTSGAFDTLPPPRETPEPVTLAIVGAGLAFGAAVGRRNKARLS
jgi:hypothetical protein